MADTTGERTGARWVFEKLREAGWAVVAFQPNELGGASASRVEDRLVELGWDVIADLRGTPEDAGPTLWDALHEGVQ